MKHAIMKGASILTVVLMISMVFTPLATAAPIQPHTRWGIAYDSGATPITGEFVLAFIDGVQYGDAATDGTGLFTLDVDGDDISDATIKSGGVNGDTIQYVRSTSTTGLTTGGTFFTETDSFVSASNTNADLNEVASSPALLKISAVATQSSWGTGGEYFRVYNPTGGAVDITGWTYDTGAGAAAVTADIGINPIPATSEIYCDATLADSDSIQLISPGGYVVDRVEYGTIGASPEETIMPNAAAPGAGQEIYRVGFGDTNDCSVDFATQPEQVDTDDPTSSVDAIAPYWYNTSPLAMTATASDPTSSVVQVEFFYSFEGGAWTSFNVDTGAPWAANFAWLDGEGNYGFYTIATDLWGNVEAAPAGADQSAGYDITNPVAGAGADMTINVATQKLDATATDALSGVASTLWTYPGNVICSNDNILDPDFSASADGVYTVTLTVTDNAGNIHQDTFQLTWDTTGPVLSATTPVDTAIDVALGQNVILTFDAAVVGLTYSCVPDPGGWGESNVGGVYTLTHNAFNPGQLYTFTVLTATDALGNPFTATVPNPFTFTTVVGDSATATGPTNDPAWSNVAGITITYTWSGSPAGVDLYYDSGSGLTFIGTDATVDGNYGWTVPADGIYGWAADAGEGSAVVEVGDYQYDGTDPTSSVNGPLNTWYNAGDNPLTISVTAGDTGGSGLDYVQLWYSYNGGAYVQFGGDDTAAPYEWSFTFPGGDGSYDFYSIAADNAGNVEAAPGAPDQSTGYDTQDPSSTVDADGNDYSASPQTISVSTYADAGPSGLASIELFYNSGSGWTSFGSDAAAPYEWSFTFPDGEGYYEFYSIATDNAGNVEAAPGVNDTWCGYHIGAGVPTSWNMYNGQNYRTFSSSLTGGWMASDLAEDIIAYINANHGEDLVEVDVTVTLYNSVAGSFQTCYFIVGPNIWFMDFALVEGDGYIISILNNKLDSQPLTYELPNFEITAPVTVNLYNGQNYRGFPVTSGTMASHIADDIILYINANHGEDLVEVDVTVTMYNSVAGSFQTCYFIVGPNIWFMDFALNPGDAYIVSILNNKLDSQPLTYIPS